MFLVTAINDLFELLYFLGSGNCVIPWTISKIVSTHNGRIMFPFSPQAGHLPGPTFINPPNDTRPRAKSWRGRHQTPQRIVFLALQEEKNDAINILRGTRDPFAFSVRRAPGRRNEHSSIRNVAAGRGIHCIFRPSYFRYPSARRPAGEHCLV